MKTTQHSTIVVGIISGLVGAAVWNHLPTGERAQAGEIAASDKDALKGVTVVRAQRIDMVNKEGRVRGELAIQPDGNPGLAFYDQKGAVALSFGLTKGGKPVFTLKGEGGRRINMGVCIDGAPTLAFCDDRGKVRATLRLEPSGNPVLAFDDANGKTRVVLGRISSEVFKGSFPKRSLSSLVLLDKDEKVIWQAP